MSFIYFQVDNNLLLIIVKRISKGGIFPIEMNDKEGS